ncbi:MAG: carboxylating nicotinate-nucleotide diphosphorylase [Desulfobacteraceae bacterium]|nr:carboxylating nicotinate-nucleotide diphosphorylase [Desulfobacteraceae bacterium]
MDTLKELISLSLFEDCGLGDITTENLIDKNVTGSGVIIAKEPAVLSGVDVASKVFKMLDPDMDIQLFFSDGDSFQKNDILLEVKGELVSMLKAERVALNFLQRLSGIATYTRSIVDGLDKNHKVRIVDTRKTTPGWRSIEKKAVLAGGAYNHRMALFDGVLLKDNHIAVAGSIKKAVEKIRPKISHLLKIEVEVSTMEQVKEAIDAGAEVIMLDNMDLQLMQKAVQYIDKRAIVEASGNMDKQDINKVAATGVDVISIGALTHQAKAVDLSMRISID